VEKYKENLNNVSFYEIDTPQIVPIDPNPDGDFRGGYQAIPQTYLDQQQEDFEALTNPVAQLNLETFDFNDPGTTTSTSNNTPSTGFNTTSGLNDAQAFSFFFGLDSSNTFLYRSYEVQNSTNFLSNATASTLSALASATARNFQNGNYQNVGSTLVETPFWRHNFPANKLIDGSINVTNVSKEYYSFFGGGFMNIADDTEYKDAGISKKPLYMGLKNDLDSYNDSSKYFPGGYRGSDWDFYGGEPTSDINYKNRVKTMLTNHNSGVVNVFRTYNDNLSIDNESINAETNYNRTQAWKGALAYLFLSNQFHKPWTGMYSSSLLNLGPQGMLGAVSSNQKIPRHSVLMLGAVLWRMREDGLFVSDNPRWNIDPVITGGFDPVCYPVLPEKIKWKGQTWDTLNFVRTNDTVTNNQAIPYEVNLKNTWTTNHGVRPPQLSLATLINNTT
jgi:hypothetical protein